MLKIGLAALVVGFVLGMIRLAVDTPVSLKLAGFEDGYAPGSLLWILNNVYFQYYSLVIFIVAVVVVIGVRYATATDEHRRHTRSSWERRDVIGSGIVLGLILLAYLFFTG